MNIAPGVTVERWAVIEGQLNDPASQYWTEAVEVFDRRIRERFLVPVQLLIDDDEPKAWPDRRHGFAIMALDCLLIETLQSFYDGDPGDPGLSGTRFRTFLTQRPAFAVHFNDEGLARQFCDDFRNGILHQAEIKRQSRVWSVGPLLQVNGNGLTVNRTLFHEALLVEFAAYKDKLFDQSKLIIRNHFRRKMRHIARMPPV